MGFNCKLLKQIWAKYTDPCGTPTESFLVFENVPFKFTFMALFER